MITIDATNQSIGRIASQAAHYLLGKHEVSFTKNNIAGVKVTITNASKASITEKKKSEKQYAQFSGYPGGLRFETLNDVIEKKGIEEVYKRAVKRMLPSNKLRSDTLKNLTITA